MTVQCCRCKKLRIDDQWIRPRGAQDAQPSHTYCPLCLETTIAEFRAEAVALAAGRPCMAAERV